MAKKTSSLIALVVIVLGATAALGQRPRPTSTDPSTDPKSMPAPSPAPQTVKAKYEGGVFGYRKRIDGTLNFDDANQRLVFRDGQGKELFPLPFQSITGAYADTHKVRPKAATIGSVIPDVGFPIGFIKTKVRYLTLQYDDPDSKVAGATSFRLENKELIDSVLFTLANKAGLTRRGDIFVRKKP